MPETTTHNHGPNFGRHVPGCPRCGELADGAPARDSRTAPADKPTKHTCNDGAGPRFGRKTPGCHRCDELLAGDAPRRPAWVDTLGRRAEYAAQDRADQQKHFAPDGPHARGECGAVCTAFDW